MTETADGLSLRIRISGRFDFNSQCAFQEVTRKMDAAEVPKLVSIDLTDTSFMDSAGLGMLLSIKDKALRIELVGATDQVRSTLERANFHRLFPVAGGLGPAA